MGAMARRAGSPVFLAGRALFGRRWVVGAVVLALAFLGPPLVWSAELAVPVPPAPSGLKIALSLVLGVVIAGLAPSAGMGLVLGWIAGAGCLQRTPVLAAIWGPAVVTALVRLWRESPSTRRRAFGATPRSAVVAALASLVIVLLAWGVFGPSSGMPTETQFVIASEKASGLAGFISADRTRPQCETFYHLAYLLGRATGCKGSFAPYQWVYAALWWAKGVLVFLALSSLLPGRAFFCHVAACLVLVHAADQSLEWVGQINQLGFTFWLLLATLAFTRAHQARSLRRERALLTLAFFAEYMTLWSYESPIFILLALPWIVRLAAPRKRALTVAWYVIPAIWFVWTALRYGSAEGAATYQAAMIRKEWPVFGLLGDWAWNVGQSVAFWSWGSSLLPWSPARPTATLLAFVAGGVFLASSIVQAILARKDGPLLPSARSLAVIAALGAFLVVASFPAYLLLASARSLWRTQMLSGLGAGIFFCAVFSLAASLLRRLAVPALLVLGCVHVFFGVRAAVLLGAYHHEDWLKHKRVVARMLEQVPRLQPDTVVVLTGVPEDQDPFGSGLWFEFAVRLAYPRSPVTGVYFREGGKVPPLSLSSFHDGGCYWNELGATPVRLEPGTSRIGSLASVVAFTWGEKGEIELARVAPPELGDDEARRVYRPLARLEPGGAARDAARRYLER